MASVKFIIKGTQEYSTIYLRFKHKREVDVTISTQLKIKSSEWSKAKSDVKNRFASQNSNTIATQLEEIRHLLVERLNLTAQTEISDWKEWLKEQLSPENSQVKAETEVLLIDQLKNYQDLLKHKVNPKTGKPISAGTIRNFNTTIKRLTQFETHSKKSVLIKDVDLNFHSNYSVFCKTIHLAQNSISKDIKQIKTACSDARDRGLTVNSQVFASRFNAPSEASTFVTLTENELLQISQFQGATYLENVRDWLLIGCWTGCRFSDLMLLTIENIKTHPSGQQCIKYIQSKTAKEVLIPIHPTVSEIVAKRNGFPTPISNQRFNSWIKIVAQKVGLTQLVHGSVQDDYTHKKVTGTFKKYELIRSHTCRRTFATLHYNKLPNKLIMAVTGHASEGMLMKYIGEVENDHLDHFYQLWEGSTIQYQK